MALSILVLGAGELGTAILTALTAQAPPATKISVLLRPQTISSANPTKVQELQKLKDLNVDFVGGDIASDSVATLASTFKPYDLIISCLGFASGPGSQIKITQAVLQAGVRRFVPWQFGVDYERVGRGSAQTVWDEQLDVREILKTQKETEWIIVSTGIFMSFLFEAFFGVVDVDFQIEDGEKGVVRALGSWENKVTVTTPEDIGRLTALVVFSIPLIANEIVFIAGETISYGKLADVVDQAIGRNVRREVWDVDQLKKDLKADPEDTVKKYRVVFAEGKGVNWDKKGTWNEERGVSMTGIRKFAEGKLGGN